ncbi:hypothetical protein HK107_11690 [Parvularcula sp. ZS-1/3]|uniref:Bacteriophage tail tape measure C-terminal domain-containing protein n=1 Tax=Parvularcula mediterranea TaxID=2732508 RepID=A0A7Y3RMT3_9PROT|nr:phage tail tape measure C-terminal domain-containing protein [Parvularcula mediterranea]NNU16982.1 hypothetical protein [Parvularcula mediterranea]
MPQDRQAHSVVDGETEAQLRPVAAAIETAFSELARSLTDELERASAEGRQSMRELADGVIEDLARMASQRLIGDPLSRAFGGQDGKGSDIVSALIKRSMRNG